MRPARSFSWLWAFLMTTTFSCVLAMLKQQLGVLKRQRHVVHDWLLTSHFADGKTTVMRSLRRKKRRSLKDQSRRKVIIHSCGRLVARDSGLVLVSQQRLLSRRGMSEGLSCNNPYQRRICGNFPFGRFRSNK